jgi:2-C-methyl-D-erythritol 2,4-cyclodiphosphate synthase
MRVGFGFDAHPLVEGRALVLGGVPVPFECGLSGHSDGDVLTHAIMDALLGAASLGDKGFHFPSSNEEYRDISSLILLSRTGELVRNSKWQVVNVDATMLAQRPVLAPYMQTMKQNISAALSIPEGDVSIKATTTDYLGFVGRGEGLAAFAVALVEATA